MKFLAEILKYFGLIQEFGRLLVEIRRLSCLLSLKRALLYGKRGLLIWPNSMYDIHQAASGDMQAELSFKPQKSPVCMAKEACYMAKEAY